MMLLPPIYYHTRLKSKAMMQPLPPTHYHLTLKSKVVVMMPLPPCSEKEGGNDAITTLFGRGGW